ncbi:MAG: YcaQ family DNA glycosylase [Opitutae bacterium]|nr:YcaQ family DNA glycosylase [Opitutae bacterium]
MIHLRLAPATARRFHRRALLLDTPAPTVAAALDHHGYIQIDPLNVCGRMHDLILRNRVAGYREGDLLNHLHSPARPGFEHYLPHAGILVAFPAAAWPYLSPLLASRRLRPGPAYRRPLSPKHEALAQHILAELAARGPLTSDDIEHEGRSVTGWGSPGRLVKNLLEVLFVHGRVLITARKNFRRVYDLPARVLPATLLHAPPKTPAEIARWTALLRLRQRRLCPLKRGELAHVADLVQPVSIDGIKTPPLYVLRSDLLLFSEIETPPASPFEIGNRKSKIENPPPALLAPLDPLIYDRRLTSALWNFDYTWEVYTPAPKRRRGYYALPVLAGTEIVGHVDPKADRPRKKLRVVSRSIKRGHRVAPAVAALASWLGLRP